MRTTPEDDSRTGLRTVIFTGHARLPQSLVAPGSSAVVSVEIEVDLESQRIVNLGAQGMLPRAEELVRKLLVGEPLDERLNDVLPTIQARYVGPCQRAICSAIANAYEAYLRYQRQDIRPT